MKYIVGLSGIEINDKDSNLLHNEDIGGVILYSQNTAFSEKRDLRNFIHDIRTEANRDILITIDEEGGFVSRLFRFLPAPSPYYLYTLYKEGKVKKVKEYIKQKAEGLKYLDIDVNLAPVVDFSDSYKTDKYGRLFGYGDKGLIIDIAKLWIKEHQKFGIKSCIKHFPGIGRSSVDSHDDLPIIDITKKEWEETEQEIFFELVKEMDVDVMVGHVKYTSLYPDEITSISNNWLSELKRIIGEGSSKVWMDSLNMNAINNMVESGIINKEFLTSMGYDYAIIKDPYEEKIGKIFSL